MFLRNSKTALLFGFGLLLMLMVALGLIGVSNMSSNQKRMQTLVNESNVKTELVTTMRYIARERSLNLISMFLTDDPFVRDEELMRFNALAGKFIEARQRFESMKLRPQEKAVFARALAAVRTASAAQEQAVNAILSDRDKQAGHLLVSEAISAQNSLLPAYNEIVDSQRALIRQDLAEADRAYQRNLILTLILGTAAVATGVLVAAWVIRATLQAENALFREKELAQVTLHSIADGVITTDTLGHIDYLNPVGEKLTGWKNEEAKGLPLSSVYQVVDETTREPITHPMVLGEIDGQVVGLVQHALVNRDGKEFSVADSAAPIRDKQGQMIGTVLVFNDVTESRSLARQLTWQASHDALTGLANRREFERRLTAALDNARTQDKQHVLLYLDLDQFKVVNDTCGHIAGDEMLRQLTALLANLVRDSDTLARLGGDEFGVLLGGCPVDQGIRIAEAMRQTIAGFKFAWEDKLFEVGASIGLVPINRLSDSMAVVLSEADAACYAAKEDGRNRVRVSHGDADSIRRHSEMQWVSRISKALEENRLVLFAQDIRPLAAMDRRRHCEILVRMRDENGLLVPPTAFIPAAERYNLMSSIDRWVVRHTFDWLAARGWREQDAVLCSINLSGQSLCDGSFLDFVVERFDACGIPPGRICFEVTETAAIANLKRARFFIARLRDKGCLFALDDFGSGMSSYGYLKNLAVDFLKIDGVFVKDMVDDPVDFAMVESINRIGHVIGIKTIAEFVENESILDKLRELGVDYAQGYGLHQPEPLLIK